MSQQDDGARANRPLGRQSRAIGVILLAAMLALSGCASTPPPLDSALAVNEGPLGGESLAQRKRDLDRAGRDLAHIRTSLESLLDRRDDRGVSTFDPFVTSYLGTHLAPLLRSEWQSRHPELMARDASLRLAEAELWILLRYPRRVQRVIDEIEQRYRDHGQMLVASPTGGQRTLDEGLAQLRDRKWSG